MLNLVKIISSRLEQGKRLLKFLRYGKSDVQTSTEAMPFGLDSNPPKDMIAIYGQTGQDGQTVIIGYVNRNQLAEVGGYRTYSTDNNGVEKGYTYLRANGDLELLGDTNFAVKFNELKTSFNELQNQWNAFANAYVPGGPATQGLPPTAIPSNANIDTAKNEKIKTNG